MSVGMRGVGNNSTLVQLSATVAPILKLDLALLYVRQPIVQRSRDRSQSAVVFGYIDIWMALKAYGTDPRDNRGSSNTECLK